MACYTRKFNDDLQGLAPTPQRLAWDGLVRAADRRIKGPANDPRRIMRWSLIRVEPAEIYCVAMKWRGDDRSRRHHGLAGARGNTAKVIISVRAPDQIPSVALEATTAGIKEFDGRRALGSPAG